jgi:hypothetical protein
MPQTHRDFPRLMPVPPRPILPCSSAGAVAADTIPLQLLLALVLVQQPLHQR